MADAPPAVSPSGSDYPPSYYAATANEVTAPRRLEEKLRTDVCVIGGGYTGLSAALHLVGLGERSFHHDEAIHAKLSYDLAFAKSYRYDPTYHGPLLYYLTALTYRVVPGRR